MRPVIFVAPFLLETTLRFARAAAHLDNARLLGVFQEEPAGSIRSLFADFVVVGDALNAEDLIAGIDVLRKRHGAPHRIVGVLEPLQTQLAQARQHFGVPGTDVKTAELFRNKAMMKDELRKAGLPCAQHALLTTADEGPAFAQKVGYPIVLKPPAGMGAKATFRVENDADIRAAVSGMGASKENPVLAEEFLRGEEGSFDTLTIGGEVQHQSISLYLPTPLTVLENPWIQWRCVLPLSAGAPQSNTEYAAVEEAGKGAISALGLKDGFTHMEWFRRDDGSVAIGEIAQRPPGAHITRMIGLAGDFDPYRAWARAVVDSAFDGPYPQQHAVGCAYLRGIGRGRVTRVDGVDDAQQACAGRIIEARLPRVGAFKNDSYEGDGHAIVKDASTDAVKSALDSIVANIRVHYG